MTTTKSIACADWGGEHIRSAIVTTEEDTFHLNDDTFVSVNSENLTDIQDILEQSVGKSVKKFNSDYHGIVINVAGPVDSHSTVLSAPNTKALNSKTPHDLRSQVKTLFKKPTLITNDLEASLAGETEMGALKGKKWAMLENIGTGWGGARLYNGVAVAAEPGHVWVPGEGDPLCGCGKYSCAEARLGGGSIKKQILDACPSLGKKIPNGTDPCAFVDRAVEAGEDWAVKFYTKIAHSIGEIWGSNLNNCPLFTDIVYQGSFLENAMEIALFRQEVRQAMINRTMNPQRHKNLNIQKVQAPRHKSGATLGPIYGNAKIFMQGTDL